MHHFPKSCKTECLKKMIKNYFRVHDCMHSQLDYNMFTQCWYKLKMVPKKLFKIINWNYLKPLLQPEEFENLYIYLYNTFSNTSTYCTFIFSLYHSIEKFTKCRVGVGESFSHPNSAAMHGYLQQGDPISYTGMIFNACWDQKPAGGRQRNVRKSRARRKDYTSNII